MDTLRVSPGVVYGAYVVWLLAGSTDFLCHRRTSLATTSGVPESKAHLVQLGLLALAIAFGVALVPTPATIAGMAVLVVVHGIVGYADTRIAFAKKRVILPIEQHVHSILDMAPIIGFAGYLLWTWPAALAGGWVIQLREPAPTSSVWVAILLPAVVLCVLPAMVEFRSAWRVRAVAAHDLSRR